MKIGTVALTTHHYDRGGQLVVTVIHSKTYIDRATCKPVTSNLVEFTDTDGTRLQMALRDTELIPLQS